MMVRGKRSRPAVAMAVAVLSGALGCVGDPPPLPLPEEPEGPATVVFGIRNKNVDILFVIDNSGSMAEEQAKLVASFETFISVLERPEVGANYRIGITTTDNGNPWCGTTGPEAGALRLTSCRSRPTEFTFNGATMVESFDDACAAVCPEEYTNIAIQPTAIDGQNEPAARPWIESIEGHTNLPEGLSTTQAFQCFGPQGIDGCGFESHLESMWKSLRRSTTDGDEAYGFIRANAILAIVHLTDEVDCSFNNDWETVFLPDGNRVFWSDETAASPTSAVCWNAGATCEGTDCHSVNLDVDGNEVDDSVAEEQAVLRPMSRYIDIVQELETNKQVIMPDQEVLVALIGGVNADGSVTYQPSLMDQQFQNDFGIGPGCSSAAGTAVPPVRMRELAEAFQVSDQRNMFSVCSADYSPALEAIAEAIAEQISPASICVPACVEDLDPSTTALDPACDVYYYDPNSGSGAGSPPLDERVTIPACDGIDPSSVPLCFVLLTDDELPSDCADAGWNTEVLLMQHDPAALPAGVIVAGECEVAAPGESACGDGA